MNEYGKKQIAEQTSGDIELWIQQQKEKYDNEKYFYDDEEARRFNKFVSKLELDKGKKGAKIKLLKFQFIICTSIICVKKRETGLRRFTESHLNIPRKNSKSFIIACIVTYLYYCRNEYGSETLISANTSQQAGLMFNTIQHMVRHNKTLDRKVKIVDSRKYMYKKNMNAYLRVISSDASNADSYAAFISVLDEIHEAKNGDLYDKCRTGMGIWDEPILFTTTTASSGQDPNNLEFEIYNYAKDIERGEIEDESFYYAIYEADKNCDLLDEEQWFKSNPALGTFRKYDDLKSLALKATRLKTRESAFRRLYLNQHVAMQGEDAINMDLWDECTKKVDLNELRDMPYWAGNDMSRTNDITAYVQCFYDEDSDKYIIVPHMFTPKDTLYERSERDNIRYDVFVEKEELIALVGKSINIQQLYNYIEVVDAEFSFNAQEIAYDRYGATEIREKLKEKCDVIDFGQGYFSMNPAIRAFENFLLENRIVIDRNSCLRWQATNVVATFNDAMDIKYNKKRSKEKIDGIIAMIMALARAIECTKGEQPIDYNKYLSSDYLEKLYG